MRLHLQYLRLRAEHTISNWSEASAGGSQAGKQQWILPKRKERDAARQRQEASRKSTVLRPLVSKRIIEPMLVGTCNNENKTTNPTPFF